MSLVRSDRVLRDLPLRTKLNAIVAAFVTALIIVAGVLAAGAWSGDRQHAAVTDHVLAEATHVARIAQQYEQQRAAMRETLLADTPEAQEQAYARLVALDVSLDTLVSQTRVETASPAIRTTLDSLAGLRTRTRVVWDAMRDAARTSSGSAVMAAYRARLKPLAGAMANHIAVLQDTQMKEAQSQVATRTASTRRVLMIALALALMAAVGVLWFTRRVATVIVTPLRELSDVATHVATGDLTHDVTWRSADEIGRLGDAIRAVVGTQREFATTM